MKKVIIFSTAYFPFVGGAEVAVKELTDRMGDFSTKGGPASGWEFDMITTKMDSNLPDFERVGRVNVYRVGLGWGGFDKFILPILGFLKARQLNKKNHYTLIWSIMASQASVAAAFFKITYPRAKLLLTLQEGDEEEHLKRYALGIDFLYRLLIKPWHLLVFKKADFITAISNYLKERAEKNGVKCPIEIIPNGVDIHKFQMANDSPRFASEAGKSQTNVKIQITNVKQKLGIKEDEKVIITVSRLVEKNAVDDLISAFAKLQTANYKLLILGSGPLEKSLKLQVTSLKLQDKVLFLGNIPNDEVPKYLAIADVFVRPSLSEGLGIVFLEAMATRVPIIGTPVGGITDFLEDGETGLFCEVKNPKSIAEKIKILLENNELREKIVKNAKELVAKNYNWDTIAPKMEKIFRQLTINN